MNKKYNKCEECWEDNPTNTNFPWCQTCGAELVYTGDWERWDQTDPKYTDVELQNFARKATDFLIGEEYQKLPSWHYSVDFREGGESSFKGGYEGGIITYNMKQLRKKRSCSNEVAHEAAHAHPANIISGVILKQGLNKLTEREKKLIKSGHHQYWKERWLNEFREKVKNKFPDYWGE